MKRLIFVTAVAAIFSSAAMAGETTKTTIKPLITTKSTQAPVSLGLGGLGTVGIGTIALGAVVGIVVIGASTSGT